MHRTRPVGRALALEATATTSADDDPGGAGRDGSGACAYVRAPLPCPPVPHPARNAGRGCFCWSGRILELSPARGSVTPRPPARRPAGETAQERAARGAVDRPPPACADGLRRGK
ncbi:hypothetical protein GCM10010211_13510 [Streptomyces albospinus]|uniref:Uncharacterized protein n=1 Tax=Streptomyces albospinus TaxID=285515 RepID=A0ABQ2UT73_9ACTN|nr:hypothetical protein GCM10010211_13510 [Streptomyces albospinus]